MKPEYKNLRSLAAAFLLLVLFAGVVHIAAGHLDLKTDDGSFGPWYSADKDLSYNGITDNLGENTVLLLGSSEFKYGRTTRYHPVNLFADEDFDFMEVGGPLNQSLFHAVVAGAVAPKLKSGKVILFLSPTWFNKKGVSSGDYALRFSETQYIHFLENPDVSAEGREYVISRTNDLLENKKKWHGKVSLINRALADENAGPLTRFLFKIERILAEDRDRMSTSLLLRIANKDKFDPLLPQTGQYDVQDLIKMEKEAVEESEPISTNPFLMKDTTWERDYIKKYKGLKGEHTGSIRKKSPEMDDLRAFLEVCRSTGLKTKVIILPVNGRWFDYVGCDKSRRDAMADRVIKMSEEYGAEAVNLMEYAYVPYLTNDSSHPWHVGWLKVDKEVLEFCEKE